jgi:dynein heavy chain
MVEEAFRLNVKWSLQELSKAINGDGKSAPNPQNVQPSLTSTHC